MMVRKTISYLFTAVLLLPNAAPAELKIGFVNVPAVLEKAPQAEKAKRELEQEFSPRDKRLVAEQKQIQSMEEQMARDSAVMSESERTKMERDILSKKRDAKRAQDEFREDFNLRRNEELSKLQREVLEAIRAIAQEERFDLLLTDGVVFASDQVDVTQKVQEKLNAAGPAN